MTPNPDKDALIRELRREIELLRKDERTYRIMNLTKREYEIAMAAIEKAKAAEYGDAN